MDIHQDILRPWITRLLQAAGTDLVSAETIADVFIRSSRRGLGHHDIHDLPHRLELLHSGRINPAPSFTVLRDEPALLAFDGDGGPGELCCSHALEGALQRAGHYGIGLATVRRSNHFLAAYPYVQRGAERGALVLVLSNTDPTMTGPGGTEAIIGNNPLGFGAPGTPPLLFDSCLAYSSIGHLQTLRREGGSIPPHWALGPDETPTTDPGEALEGWRLRPIGEHKGFGLALMQEVLTAVLAGGETTTAIQRPGGINSHSQTVIAIAPDGSCPESFSRGVKTLEEQMAARGERLPGAAGANPGPREEIHVREETWAALEGWSETLGVGPPGDNAPGIAPLPPGIIDTPDHRV
ncbi:Malate/lactate/ureidoglycolate dehydrogenase, LDH2 family [Alkalispirochaeta americana]|uniref:Malate/lactate/ureidoglycolate dehydrogenase, LDH2 family n=1 Tax=Alkalispirochaeta americana TaxID=159291 RepID=A0A1N6N4S4_9SPIO|nr:Ldh family oxidoreductase [Alkalispirochaeta americana]SIP87077.1 Malate/lactate/ureidoglycolate dehydrogenase, LDH2 family [Alkalispirochaeta americana]